MSDDQYSFWRRRLAGELLPIHESEPQAGFYRLRVSREPGFWYPVAYWYGQNDGALRCRIADRNVDEREALERWPFASKTPITHEVYKAVIAGAPWPDQHEAVIRDRANSNAAPDDNSFEALKDRIEDLARDAAALISAGGAKDQTAADQASDLANRLGELHKQADAARAAEKKPHDDEAKRVQAKWSPILATAEIYKRIKAAVITPWLVAETARQREATEAARKAAEAQGAVLDTAQRAAPKAGSGGRRSVALREHTVVTITDRDALLAYFAHRQEITEALQRMAELAVKAKVTPPGVAVTTESRAA